MANNETGVKFKDFIGKTVLFPARGGSYVIEKLTATKIEVREEKPDEHGTYAHYVFESGTGPCDNAITRGSLVFVDESLKQPFVEVYEAYRNSAEGRMESYLEYMGKWN